MGKNRKKRRVAKKSREADSTTRYEKFDNPFEGFTSEQMEQVRAEIGLFHEGRFQESMKQLIELVKSTDCLYLLPFLSVNNLFVGVTDSGALSKGWENPKIPQCAIELIQAISLSFPLTERVEHMPLTLLLERIYEVIPSLLSSYSFKRLANSIAPSSDKERAVILLQERIRLHTQNVRNWGYYEQSLRILKDLYGPLDPVFRKAQTTPATCIIALFEYLKAKAETRLVEHIELLRPVLRAQTIGDAVAAYGHSFGLPEKDNLETLTYFDENRCDVKIAKEILIFHSFEILQSAFMFEVSELPLDAQVERQQICQTLQRLSIGFGELDGYDVEKLVLDNPVWTRPFIRLSGESYFCPMPQLFTGFSFAILNTLSIDDSIEKAVIKRRSKFLEDAVRRVFSDAFPGSLIFPNVKWREGESEYETDLIVVVDSYLIIVESKSAKVTHKALRGEVSRAKRKMMELLVEPSIQSLRLEKQIRLAMNAELGTSRFISTLDLDFSRIFEVARISVTLEDFATIQSNLAALEDTGWIPDDFHPAVTMTLADLQTVFDVLSHASERLYYLVRRSHLERRIKYHADEMDLLGFYLDNGFCTGDWSKEDGFLYLTGTSSAVDNFIVARETGCSPPKPKRKMTKWWTDLISRAEETKPFRWSEVALMLLSVDFGAQKAFEKGHQKIMRRLNSQRRSPTGRDSVVLLPDGNRTDAFATVVLKAESLPNRRELMNNLADRVLEQCNSQRCLVLALRADSSSYPYLGLGVYERSS